MPLGPANAARKQKKFRGETMRIGAKKNQMIEYEMSNCKRNISFYKDQMNKNDKNSTFYAEQIILMQKKLEELEDNINMAMSILTAPEEP
jgi:hypothetical protein